ncbi:MAG: succinyl-CoA synthetase subunit beta [Sulfitobacter sp.]|nr:succinyl-CoA synthetase subunit beta [Sulfitobacter sp.]
MSRFAFIRRNAVAILSAAISTAVLSTGATAGGTKSTARAAMQLFADHCFSPYMTAEKAAKAFALSGASYDFYDLDPFSNVEPSPAMGRPATPGTDRRCEISFAGDCAETAAQVAVEALAAEGINQSAALPDGFGPQEGTQLLAARQLNPRRVAVVHVGTRPGDAGVETFMLVERLQEGRGLEKAG